MPTPLEDAIFRMSDDIRALRNAIIPEQDPVDPPGPMDPVDPPSSDVEVAFPSGIRVTGARSTMRPHWLKVEPGQEFSFLGGNAKRGLVADGRNPFGIEIVGHTVDTRPVLAGTHVLQEGEAIVIAVPKFGHEKCKIQEAVVVSSWDPDSWARSQGLLVYPRLIQGATAEDVAAFLLSTDVVPEFREGWPGGLSHAFINFGEVAEQGYGAVIAERTGFGSALLMSDLGDSLKKLVQDRMLIMAQDLECWDVNYPANGGHGVGRYILWLLRRAFTSDSNLSPEEGAFAEINHLVPYSGPGNLGGYGFRHQITLPVDMANNYVTCCTANRWAGSALLAKHMPSLGAHEGWIRYSTAYLTWKAEAAFDDWFVKNPRTRTLIMANRSRLGF